MSNQKFTSACTSINSSKLPAIYGKSCINWRTDILDYGCGRYTDHLEKAVSDRGGKWCGYDVYNYAKTENLNRKYDVVICSNVLNVIAEDSVVENVIADIMNHVTECGKAYFTVYVGNSTGIGKQTGNDSYQRNAKLIDYMQFFKRYNAIRKNGMIIVENCIDKREV